MQILIRYRAVCGALLIAVLVFIAYWPALRGGFIWDDSLLIVKNRLVRADDGLYRFWLTTEPFDYWPLTNSSFWLEWRLWGINPIGYHVTNVVLHIAAAWLIWLILRRLSIPSAFLAALLFAVHPVNVESVAWIAQRKNTLAMLFFLLSVLWYLRQEEGKRERGEEEAYGLGRWYWLSLLAFLLAMLSKGSVAVLPLVLLLMIWWQRQRISRSDLWRTVPFFVVAMGLTAVNLWFSTHGADIVVRDVNVGQRVAGAGAAAWFYLSKGLLPIDLVFVYPQWHIRTDDLRWWLPALACVAVTGMLWLRRKSPSADWVRPLLMAWMYFGVALLPVLGFADVGFMRFSLVADHYQHLAVIGVTALVAAGWSVWRLQAHGLLRSLANCAGMAALGALVVLSWQQSRLYGDAVTLYRATLQQNPDCWVAHNNLGERMLDAGQIHEAQAHFEEALRLKPDYPEAHNNLGAALAGIGKLPEAIAEYQQALLLRPNSASVHNNLGNAWFASNQPQQAIQQHELALQLKPDYPEAHFNLAIDLAAVGRLQEALDHYQQAISLQPDYAEAYANLAQLYAALNRSEESNAAAEKALELARSSGQNALIVHLEAWLEDVRLKQGDRQK